MRVALGVSYRGGGYNGWQSQADGRTVQDALAEVYDRLIREHVHSRW